MTGTRSAPAPEVCRAQVGTWTALVVVPVGITVLLFLYVDVNPVVHGMFAVVAALQIMIALHWRRNQNWRR
ncbi:hypothetical protein FHU33_2775 [Blastococcus colisei]|uniref:Uncharacterized protein n=1 Tax=Blastococcus colisei TaxID=1564162 RepID=A0A543PGX7_9ACTN|nr:hypothetical protein [Blastococcus colisei]TQN43333.1 hypothetical protein FHU33_2775 [Blastococcus colisei]